jgi:hypothetical protein
MSPQSLDERVDALEKQMSELRELPVKVGELSTQVSQFRTDMDAGFSALRIEIRAGDEETRRHMRVLHEEVIDRIKLLHEGISTHQRNTMNTPDQSAPE